MVVLVGLPPGFLEDLPIEDQIAIRRMVGKPMKFIEITSVVCRGERIERTELEFYEEQRGVGHSLFVDPGFIRTMK